MERSLNKSQKFTDLIVWQKSHALVLTIYNMTSTFPKEEVYGLTSQIRRSAVSIPANIDEGFIKRGIKDKVRFFNIAQGSLEELKYYLILVNDLKYYLTNDIKPITDEIGKLLNGYIKSTLNSNS
jgi:four helix bundle protein